MDNSEAFRQFKDRCSAEGFLQSDFSSDGDDISSGLHDDGTLLRFLRAREFDVEKAFRQFEATQIWRDRNRLLEIYDSIDVDDYDETRRLYTHWTGRRDRGGAPICLFEIRQLTSQVMAAYQKACSNGALESASSESEATLRLFCTYENLIRFVLPLCSEVQSDAQSRSSITSATCIVDISGVGIMQLWRLRSHMQAASTLATSHYPETLGKTFVTGAPSFFPTVWGWINTWFDKNTVSKINIVPPGQEYEFLSKAIDPVNIPRQYGGKCDFEFGMLPDLDTEIKQKVVWLHGDDDHDKQKLMKGPQRWVQDQEKRKYVVAVGSHNGSRRNTKLMALR